MLHIIKTLTDPLLRLLNDDPVRPEIPKEFRVSPNSEIIVSKDDLDEPTAVVCVQYRDSVPRSKQELIEYTYSKDPEQVAVFYTIWSYRAGAGRSLINSARAHIERTRPTVTQYVTLSPKTEMARVFHTRNGASVLNDNPDSINYWYK
jgi:hypothetical protein